MKNNAKQFFIGFSTAVIIALGVIALIEAEERKAAARVAMERLQADYEVMERENNILKESL